MQDSKRLPFFLLGKPSLLPSLYNSASYIYKCLYRLAILRKSLEIPRIVRANSTCSHIYKQPRNGFSTRKDLTGRQFILLLTLPPSLGSARCSQQAPLHAWRAFTTSPTGEPGGVSTSQCEHDCTWKPGSGLW